MSVDHVADVTPYASSRDENLELANRQVPHSVKSRQISSTMVIPGVVPGESVAASIV